MLSYSLTYAYARQFAKDWLYKDDWTKQDQDTFELLYNSNVLGFRPFGSMFDDILNEKNWRSYSKTHQLDYSDIYDPRKFMHVFGQNNFTSQTVNFISSNVTRLYKDD